MNTDNETLKHIIEIWENLDKAMAEAGGRLNISQISKMSALEFIALIAPNRIRFTTLSEAKSGLKISDLPIISEQINPYAAEWN